MEDPGQLIRWFLSSADKYSIRVTRYTWTKEYLPGLCDYGVSIALDGRSFQGRGTDFDEQIALSKAIAEAFERAVGFKLGLINSNGLAAHVTKDLAVKTASLELIERDRFLCHFLLRQSFFNLPPNICVLHKFKDPLQILMNRGVAIKLMEAKRIEGVHTVVAAALGLRRSGSPFGLVLGFGCSDNLDEAVSKSLVEMLRETISVLKKRPRDYALVQALPTSLQEHGNLATDPCYGEWFQNIWVNNLRPETENKPQLHSLKMNVSNIEQMDRLLGNIPLVFSRVSSTCLIDLQAGVYSGTPQLLSVLSMFKGERVETRDIFYSPHPIN